MPMEDTIVLGMMFVNILLTVALVLIFYKNHKLVRSKITLGMLFFAGAFLLHNIANFYFYNSLLVQEIFGFTTFHLVVNLLEMVGLIALVYISLR